jgi:hypothetical protein
MSVVSKRLGDTADGNDSRGMGEVTSDALLPGAVTRWLSHPQNGGKQVNVKKQYSKFMQHFDIWV